MTFFSEKKETHKKHQKSYENDPSQVIQAVPFSSPCWMSLNHPKKVTLNHQEMIDTPSYWKTTKRPNESHVLKPPWQLCVNEPRGGHGLSHLVTTQLRLGVSRRHILKYGGGGYSIWKSTVGFPSVWLFVFMLLFKKRNFMVSRTILGGKFSIRYDNHLPKRKEDKEGKHILQQGVLRKMSKKRFVFFEFKESSLRTSGM